MQAQYIWKSERLISSFFIWSKLWSNTHKLPQGSTTKIYALTASPHWSISKVIFVNSNKLYRAVSLIYSVSMSEKTKFYCAKDQHSWWYPNVCVLSEATVTQKSSVPDHQQIQIDAEYRKIDLCKLILLKYPMHRLIIIINYR